MTIRQNTTDRKFDIATIATWHRNLFEANVTRYPNIPGQVKLEINYWRYSIMTSKLALLRWFKYVCFV